MDLKTAAATILLAAIMSAPAIAQTGVTPGQLDETSTPAPADLSKIQLDVSKSGIERPLERLVDDTPRALFIQPPNAERQPMDDQSKRLIESSLEDLVDRARGEAPIAAAPTSTSDTDNPACQPGLVRWHESFAAACTASRESGKPVLLFQLLGRLDQRFT